MINRLELSDRDLINLKSLEENLNLLIKYRYNFNSLEELIDDILSTKEKKQYEDCKDDFIKPLKKITPTKFLTRPEIAKILGVKNNTIKSWESKGWFENIGNLNSPKYRFKDAFTGIINNCKLGYINKIKTYLNQFEKVDNLLEICEKR